MKNITKANLSFLCALLAMLNVLFVPMMLPYTSFVGDLMYILFIFSPLFLTAEIFFAYRSIVKNETNSKYGPIAHIIFASLMLLNFIRIFLNVHD